MLLYALSVVIGQNIVKTAENVATVGTGLLELAQVEAVAVVENEQDVVLDNVVMPWRLCLCFQLAAQVCHELFQDVFFLRGQNQCFVGMIVKEMISVEFLIYDRPVDKLVVEDKYPAVILTVSAVILLASYLTWRISHQRTVAVTISANTVCQTLRKLVL